jgi:hypothetical protein
MLGMRTNAGHVAALMDDGARRQLPFATARAMTWLAKDGQMAVRRKMPTQFTLRNRFTLQEVRITPANKQTLTAEVGSSDRSGYMRRQQDGGIKTPRGRHIAVPVNARRGKTGIIRRANRPGALMEKPNHFIAQIGQTYGLWSRQKRGVKLMYHLIKSAQVDDRYHLDDTVTHTVASRYGRVMQHSLDDALRTAK